jgi:hypothetical protein
MTTGTVEMVTSSITSASSPCRIATAPSRCTRRTQYLLRSTLQRVQAESLLPGVPRRALQVAQSSESEALFQLGALQTTAATPAASKAAARTRSHRLDLRTPHLLACGDHSGEAEHLSGIGLTLFGFIAELVFAFIPERRSASSRNRKPCMSPLCCSAGPTPSARPDFCVRHTVQRRTVTGGCVAIALVLFRRSPAICRGCRRKIAQIPRG